MSELLNLEIAYYATRKQNDRILNKLNEWQQEWQKELDRCGDNPPVDKFDAGRRAAFAVAINKITDIIYSVDRD